MFLKRVLKFCCFLFPLLFDFSLIADSQKEAPDMWLSNYEIYEKAEALYKIKSENKEIQRSAVFAEKLKDILKEKIELEKKYNFLSKQPVLENHSKEIEELRSDLDSKNMEIENLKHEKFKLRDNFSALNRKYIRLLAQKAEIDYQYKFAVEEAKIAEDEKCKTLQKLDTLSDELENALAEKNRALEKSAQLQASIDSIKSSENKEVSTPEEISLRNGNESMKCQIELFQMEIDSLYRLKNSYISQLKKVKTSYESAIQIVATLNLKYNILHEESEVLKKQILYKTEAEISDLKKINDLSAMLAEIKKSYTLLSDKYRILQKNQYVIFLK